MKPVLITLGLLIILSLPVFSQVTSTIDSLASASPIKIKREPRFYFNIHSGYNFALGSTFKFYPDDISTVAVEMVENSAPTKNTTYKATGKGLGEGFQYGAGLSFIINDFINVGVDVNYFKSTISKVRDSSFHQIHTVNGANSDVTYNERYTISYDATLVTLNPNITFKAISRPKFFIYNKIGAVLIFRPNSIQLETQDAKMRMGWQGFFKDSSSYTQKRYEWGIKNPSLGFMGGIGAQVKLSEKLRAFSELQFLHIIFAVRSRTLTNYKVDGQELVNTLPLNQREIQFKKEFTADEWKTEPNEPATAVTQRFPVTYVGLQVGLAFRF